MLPLQPNDLQEAQRRISKADDTPLDLDSTLDRANLSGTSGKKVSGLAEAMRLVELEQEFHRGIIAVFGGMQSMLFGQAHVPELDDKQMETEVARSVAKETAKQLVLRGAGAIQEFPRGAQIYSYVVDALEKVLLDRPRLPRD